MPGDEIEIGCAPAIRACAGLCVLAAALAACIVDAPAPMEGGGDGAETGARDGPRGSEDDLPPDAVAREDAVALADAVARDDIVTQDAGANEDAVAGEDASREDANGGGGQFDEGQDVDVDRGLPNDASEVDSKFEPDGIGGSDASAADAAGPEEAVRDAHSNDLADVGTDRISNGGVEAGRDPGCPPGQVDLDGDPKNGCECRKSTELCDGQDNDCDGVPDDNGASERCVFANGIGACQGGRCVLVGCVGRYVDRNKQEGDGCECDAKPELCDGQDNDCDNVPDQTFDLQNDPRNCGQCGRSCQLDHATSVCSNGSCAVLRCADGFANKDGTDANGCECPMSEEVCDTKDNNCDGLVDVVRDGGTVTSVCGGRCFPRELPLDVRQEFVPDDPNLKSLLCSTPSCRGPAGEALMSYCMNCPTGSSAPDPWVVCQFSVGRREGDTFLPMDFREFDSAYGASGILEVQLCVQSELLYGGLYLWYGRDPQRKKLTLNQPGHTLDGGCHSFFFDPKDACGFTQSSCPDLCGDANCQLPALEQIGDITISAENCDGRTTASLLVKSMTYHPAGCLCHNDLECGAGSRCVFEPQDPLGCPPSAPCGLCRSPNVGCEAVTWIGQPCSTTLPDERLCRGTLACSFGSPVCETTQCN